MSHQQWCNNFDGTADVRLDARCLINEVVSGLSAACSAGARGKQDWQELDGISDQVKEDFPRPIPASPVSRRYLL
jgi:hypothetical protein